MKNADGQSGSISAAFTVTNPPLSVTGITRPAGKPGPWWEPASRARTLLWARHRPSGWQRRDRGTYYSDQCSRSLTHPDHLHIPASPANHIIGRGVGCQCHEHRRAVRVYERCVYGGRCPTVTGITPASGVAGTAVGTSVAGTNFIVGTTPTVWLAKTGQRSYYSDQCSRSLAAPDHLHIPASPANHIIGRAWDVNVMNADGQIRVYERCVHGGIRYHSPIHHDLVSDGWTGWGYSATWTGNSTPFGIRPVMVGTHGEHGSNVSLNQGGTTRSSVWKTFTAPYGPDDDNITFSGLLSSSTFAQGRYIEIDVNGVQQLYLTALVTPPGNGHSLR